MRRRSATTHANEGVSTLSAKKRNYLAKATQEIKVVKRPERMAERSGRSLDEPFGGHSLWRPAHRSLDQETTLVFVPREAERGSSLINHIKSA